MNEVVPAKTVEDASTSVPSQPSQILFAVSVTEVSGWMQMAKVASVCPS